MTNKSSNKSGNKFNQAQPRRNPNPTAYRTPPQSVTHQFQRQRHKQKLEPARIAPEVQPIELAGAMTALAVAAIVPPRP